MIYDNMEFFNVRELTKSENYPGVRINRFPSEIINSFEMGTPASYAQGCEIRFRLTGRSVIIYLLSIREDTEILVYFGDYLCTRHFLQKGVITPIMLSFPQQFNKEFEVPCNNAGFNRNICRVFFNNESIIHYCGIDTFGNDIMPPIEDEKPKITFLAYGSSITHGSGTVSNCNSYIQVLARKLNAQVYNFGLSGCCRIEKEISDFIAGQDCDFYLLELGVNIRSVYSKKEFKSRARYLLKCLLPNNKPIFLTTIYQNTNTYYCEEPAYSREKEFNSALNELVDEMKSDNLHLVDGNDILTDFNQLTTDFIHPSESGHIEMGNNWYKKIKEYIG